MYKHSPGRNNRSKGVKVKHVLQVCLLLAVCFWLIYQVKRSHDKKKDFDETDAKFPVKTESSNELVKLGRKDLLPRIDILDSVNEKHREEPEDETVDEDEGNKPEEDLEEENITKEKNDEQREDGEDEGDDHDQQKPETEVDQEEDIVDEDKERADDEKDTEERDSEENDNQVDEENSLEEHDHDEDSSNSHEAREEHYKADDASSAVTHDTGLTTTENESGKLEQEAEHAAEAKIEVGFNNSMQIDAGQSTTTLKVEAGKIDGEGSPPNTTSSEEKNNNLIASTAADTSASNSTRTDGLTDNSESATHLTEANTQTHDLSLLNGTQAVTQEHNVTAEETTFAGSNLSVSSSKQNSNSADMVDNNQIDSNLTFASKNDGVDSTPVDSWTVSGDTESLAGKVNQGNTTVESVDNVGLPLKDNNATEVEKDDTSDESGTTDEGVDASIAENLEEVQDDPIDTSDSSIHLEEKHIRTDLETLPEIQTEGSNMEDAAAE